MSETNSPQKKIVVRFPPSPTGNLHIGSARTALFNFLYARKHGGNIFLRLENTDENRSKAEYEANIFDALKWLGFAFDNDKVWRQNERKDIYRSHLKRLIKSGNAYISKETEGERKEVVRFKNPNKKIVFKDLIRGDIEFDTTELENFVIARSIEEPLYHLAVIIDDHEMGVTHVIRGEHGISNTPRQILIQEALGFPRPIYAHIPLILAPDRSKLSKRHGAIAVTEYRERGYLPEAIINYLALLGWNPGTNQEIFTLEELIKAFELEKVQKSGAIFSEEKLRSINRVHLHTKMKSAEFLPLLPESFKADRSEVGLLALLEIIFERMSTMADFNVILRSGEFDFVLKAPSPTKERLCWKDTDAPTTKLRLSDALALFAAVPDSKFNKIKLREILFPYAEASGKGSVLWPVRVALSGMEKSPDPFTLGEILGKKETTERLRKAVAVLS